MINDNHNMNTHKCLSNKDTSTLEGTKGVQRSGGRK